MKKAMAFAAVSVVFCGIFMVATQASAVHVNGYFRSNGTYVQGYERTAPDGNPYNNYSYPGNYNPNTGKITGGDSNTYLNNYYNKSYPTIPTCPLNSYYNGSSCTCNYGYVNSGGSCVSGNTLCWNQLGYMSSYDSLSNSCKCDSGYVIGSSGQCTSGLSYCIGKIGLMSQYNSLTRQCECMTGYQFDGSTCVYQQKTLNSANILWNDNSYVNSNGNTVHSPSYSTGIPSGATAQCKDGTYSFSQSRSGTCSYHRGVSQWLQ